MSEEKRVTPKALPGVDWNCSETAKQLRQAGTEGGAIIPSAIPRALFPEQRRPSRGFAIPARVFRDPSEE